MRMRTWLGLPVVLLACVLASPGCLQRTAGAPDEPPPGDIVVASFDFSESLLLAEIYAGALEAAGFPVARRLGLGSRELVEPALLQGHVDLVPEYSGSALTFLRGSGAATADPAGTRDALAEVLLTHDVTVLDAAPAQNRNTFAVRADTAADLGLATISDLGAVAGDLALGGPPECEERATCLRGLRDTYGLRFATFVALPPPGVVAALEGGEIDVGVLFETDPAIVSRGFTALVDDRGLQPAESVVPVVRAEVLEAHGHRLADLIDRVSAAITTDALAEMNRRVQVEHDRPADIAAEWLADHDLGA